jgi:heme/copper-type cytochrome/quinol oxidase subunit 2
MSSALEQTRPSGRQPGSALARLTLGTLLELALLGMLSQILIFRAPLPPIGIVTAVGSLVAAGVVATGWRWGPGLGALWCALTLASELPVIPRHLANPDDGVVFVLTLWLVPALLVGMATGTGATVQTFGHGHGDQHAPAWLMGALLGLLGLGLGASLVALLPRTPGVSVSSQMQAGLPTLVAANTSFSQSELRARVGEAMVLRLDNRDTTAHSFDVDELDVHVPMQPSRSVLAVFRPTQPGAYTFYCTIPGHRDQMHGMLVVEP